MKDAATIRSMFAAVSRRYDLLNHLLSLNQDKRWRRKTVERSVSRSGSGWKKRRVLDVCTGTADLAIEYADSLGDLGLVVGADFCPEMLRIGKQKIESRDNGAARRQLELMVADTLRLPFADGLFDIVSVAFGIRNVADLRDGVAEMARVAKGGGRVVILEFSLPEHGFINRVYMTYFTRLLPAIGRLVSRAGNDAYRYLPDSVIAFPRGEEMCDVMRQCGLADVTATELTFGIVTLYIGRKP